MELLTYEDTRTQFFNDQIKNSEETMERIKGCDVSEITKHIALSAEKLAIDFYKDALNALDWIKIEYDEEGMLVGFPEDGECALFCSKHGAIFLDEVCTDIESGEYTVYLDSGFDIDDLAAYMHLPKPYKE